MSHEFRQIAWSPALEDDLRQIVRLAVREDLDRQYDWTTVALVPAEAPGRAAIVARQGGVIAGIAALPVFFDEMHAAINFDVQVEDAQQIAPGAVLAELSGSARDLLTCERPLLNLLARLSGIATLAHEYVQRVEGTGAKIYDTRKTTPGWRRLEKYAVRCGGAHNHRTGLYDAILIKDNHLALAHQAHRTPADAVTTVRQFLAESSFVARDMLLEVEIDNLEQLDSVLSAAPDIVLLDNMSCDALRAAVARRDELASQVQLEASGGVSLDTVRAIAETGVDRISAGALTHSALWLDLALDWLDD